MNIELRLALEADLQLVTPLVRAYHEFEQLGSSETERELAVGKLLADRTLGGIWLIYHETSLVGYIALCKGYSIEFAGFDAFIDEFFILPQHRGRGIGRTVLERIKAEARALEIGALHLEVARENTPARKLYSDCGFDAREKYVLMSSLLG